MQQHTQLARHSGLACTGRTREDKMTNNASRRPALAPAQRNALSQPLQPEPKVTNILQVVQNGERVTFMLAALSRHVLDRQNMVWGFALLAATLNHPALGVTQKRVHRARVAEIRQRAAPGMRGCLFSIAES